MSERNPVTDDRLGPLLRDVIGRIRRLERRPDGRANSSHELPIILGGWELSEDADTGDLVATNAETGEATILASP